MKKSVYVSLMICICILIFGILFGTTIVAKVSNEKNISKKDSTKVEIKKQYNKDSVNEIKIGETYLLSLDLNFENDSENPFKRPLNYDYEILILDIKKGYVQYKYTENDLISSLKYDFLIQKIIKK